MEIFRLLGTVAIDSANATQALDEVSDKAGNTGNEVETAFGKIGAASLNIAKWVAGAPRLPILQYSEKQRRFYRMQFLLRSLYSRPYQILHPGPGLHWRCQSLLFPAAEISPSCAPPRKENPSSISKDARTVSSSSFCVGAAIFVFFRVSLNSCKD